MGLFESLGMQNTFFGNINWGAIGGWATIFFLGFVVLIISGVGAFIYYSRKAKKAQFIHKIPIFQSINGKRKRIGIDDARELFIPDTNIGLFFLKGKKIYVGRPTRSMSKNEWWYSIAENGEWVNFDLSVDPDKDTLSKANYDHRDTRYAYVNLKDIIKRNYTDQAIKWWKEYSHLITFIIVSFIFIGSCWILLDRIGGLIGQLGPILDQQSLIADKLTSAVQQAQNLNSGVVSS